MERPLFDAGKRVQSTEYYVLMDNSRTEVNKTRFFRFVKAVYRNNWNKLIVDLHNHKAEDVITQHGLNKFQATVQRKRTQGVEAELHGVISITS